MLKLSFYVIIRYSKLKHSIFAFDIILLSFLRKLLFYYYLRFTFKTFFLSFIPLKMLSLGTYSQNIVNTLVKYLFIYIVSQLFVPDALQFSP